MRAVAEQVGVLRRNVKRFRGGLVFKAHRLCITQPLLPADVGQVGVLRRCVKRFRGELVFKAP